jgi:hypothetical protein
VSGDDEEPEFEQGAPDDPKPWELRSKWEPVEDEYGDGEDDAIEIEDWPIWLAGAEFWLYDSVSNLWRFMKRDEDNDNDGA